MEIVAPLGDTSKPLLDCRTTKRYPGDYMEIVVPLLHTLEII